MLPVVAGRAATTWQILIYSVLLVPVSMLPSALGFAGTVYGAITLVCGAIFALLALRLHQSKGTSRQAAHRLFVFSISYLFLLFAALLVNSNGEHRSSALSQRGVRPVASVQAEELSHTLRTHGRLTTVRANEA
jgi:protoheme IX farnesyltransferase